MNSPMDLGFAEGLGLHITLFLFSSPSCNHGRGEVCEGVRFKSETCMTIAWALRINGYLVHSCVLHHGSPSSAIRTVDATEHLVACRIWVWPNYIKCRISGPRMVTYTVEYARELETLRGTHGVLLVAGMSGEMLANVFFDCERSGTSVQ